MVVKLLEFVLFPIVKEKTHTSGAVVPNEEEKN